MNVFNPCRRPCQALLLATLCLLAACGRAPAVPHDASAAAPRIADAPRSHAPHADLQVVHPVITCQALAQADLADAADAKVDITATTELETPKGRFCKVEGNIAPSIGFEVDLPMEHWTQRFLMGGCGGLCGMTRVGITNAGTCAPALDGEFVVAGTNMGHTGTMGGDDEALFGADPQKRIDFAYRANHQTTRVAKALIQAFYGQAQRYAYFMGCSDGGREALMEAQRFPDDFDGISAGAPAALLQLQNSYHHAWTTLANTRADGSTILLRGRLGILHQAVVEHCPTLSGVQDGLLADPRSCRFDPAWVQCSADATDTSACLTAEEVGVVARLYDGPVDAQGGHYTLGGFPMGSELGWMLPDSVQAGQEAMTHGMASRMLQYMIMPEVDPAAADLSRLHLDQATFQRIATLAPLYDATNTNLGPFQQHGGKLILWHGLADTSVNPWISIAYYQGVQHTLGNVVTDGFLRLFLLPGVGHCGGGGYEQVDLLSPLMAWTERQQAPASLIAGKPAQGQGAGAGGPPPGPPGGAAGAPPRDGHAGPPMARAGQPPAGAPHQGANDASAPAPRMHAPMMASQPMAMPASQPVATRTIYPYPAISRYTGHGDPDDAANDAPATTPVALPQVFASPAADLIGPDNQKTYHVADGKLVAD